MHKLTLLGGFALNDKPLECLYQFDSRLSFIDINQFSPPCNLDNLANAVIAKLDINQENILVAYSCGGLIALKIGMLRPDLLKQIILINSTPKFIQSDNWDGIGFVEFYKLQFKLDTLPLNNFLRYFMTIAAYPQPVKNHARFFNQVNKASLNNLLHILHITDLRIELTQLKDLIICINSDNDTLIAANKLSARQFYLQDSTHFEINESQLLKIMDNICNKI